MEEKKVHASRSWDDPHESKLCEPRTPVDSKTGSVARDKETDAVRESDEDSKSTNDDKKMPNFNRLPG